MGVINAVAEFERDLLVERTQAGLSRARAEGSGSADRRASRGSARGGARQLGTGASVSALARAYKTSRQTILRVRDANPSA
jgi:putative DNA-invertase from lambdoid prophage Rac